MTASARARSSGPALLQDAPLARPPATAPTRHRRPRWIAAAASLVVAFAFGGVLMVQRAGRATEVLVVARPVAVGQRLTAADLSTARLGGAGFAALDAESEGSILGQSAAVRLVPGQLLLRQMLTAEPVPGPGMATVGVSLRPGQLPGDGLEPGDRVRIVAVAGRGASDTAAGPPTPPQVLAEHASVYAARPDAAAPGSTVVTLLVPAGRADLLAVHGSAGQVGLIEVTP
jgi:Flp pilus assembly protein CpaB